MSRESMSAELSVDHRLAIDGGTPVRRRLLPLSEPWIDEAEAQAAAEAVRRRHLTGGGPEGRALEDTFERVLEGRRLLFMTSCTSALEAAVRLAGAGPGDEVITPSFTFVSTANAVVRAGARPVLVDIRPTELNLAIRTRARGRSRPYPRDHRRPLRRKGLRDGPLPGAREASPCRAHRGRGSCPRRAVA